MPGKSNVKRNEGTRTLTWESGRIPRTPRNVSLQRFDPYARYKTVLAFSLPSTPDARADASVSLSNGWSACVASSRSCDGCGWISKTRFGPFGRDGNDCGQLASFLCNGGGASVEWQMCVSVMVSPDCVMAAGDVNGPISGLPVYLPYHSVVSELLPENAPEKDNALDKHW
jgi:hypothetical protein